MIPEEKNAAVSRGLSETFGVTDFEEIEMLTKGNTTSLVFRIVVRGSQFLFENHHARRRSQPPLRQHASRGGSGPCASGLAYQHRRSNFHHGFRARCTVPRRGSAGPDACDATEPARTAAVCPSAESHQHYMHVPVGERPGGRWISATISGGELAPRGQDRGVVRSVRARSVSVSASRCRHGVLPQRLVQTGQCPLRRKSRLVDRLGSRLLQRPLRRPRGHGESIGPQRRRGTAFSGEVFWRTAPTNFSAPNSFSRNRSPTSSTQWRSS